MRKLFWCCVAVAVVAAGAVYLAARRVDQHPYAVVGQVVTSFCCGVQPAAGPTVASEPGLPAEPAPVGTEPVASPTPAGASEIVAVADPSLPSHIIIGEPPAPTAAVAVESASTIDAASLVKAAGGAVGADVCPSVMPYCADNTGTTPRQMPYAAEEGGREKGCREVSLFELLMGCCCKESGGEQGSDECQEEVPMPGTFLNLFRLMLEAGQDAAGNTETIRSETEGLCPPGQCPEDHHRSHHHHHCPVCPYTGRCYPLPVPQPACPPAPEEPEKKEGKTDCPKCDKEKKEMPQEESEPPQQASEPPILRVDTMEFRPSDAGLQLFIPGLL